MKLFIDRYLGVMCLATDSTDATAQAARHFGYVPTAIRMEEIDMSYPILVSFTDDHDCFKVVDHEDQNALPATIQGVRG